MAAALAGEYFATGGDGPLDGVVLVLDYRPDPPGYHLVAAGRGPRWVPDLLERFGDQVFDAGADRANRRVR